MSQIATLLLVYKVLTALVHSLQSGHSVIQETNPSKCVPLHINFLNEKPL